jgi:hypothetical protein
MTKRRNNMKDINPNQYTLAKKFKEGHRYFWFKSANYTGGFGGDRLAIADDSGDYPHLTDDGLLFVDIDGACSGNPITISPSMERVTASIPLINMDGETSHTGSSIYEAFGVAKLLGLPIKITDPYGSGKSIEVQCKEITIED